MKGSRIILAIAGTGLVLFGIFRLVTEVSVHNLLVLVLWMLAALAIHDGVLSPAVVGVSKALRHYVPDRARRFLQIGMIMSALITVIAIPMIFLRGSQPAVKALLLRNYGANLSLLIGMIAVITLILYAVRVARDRRRSRFSAQSHERGPHSQNPPPFVALCGETPRRSPRALSTGDGG